MIKYLLYFAIGIICLTIVGCDDGENYAPVMEVNTIEPIPKSGIHRAMHGETLYEIAWRYGLDYRYLAQRNHLHFPYAIHPGQAMYLQGKDVSPTKSASTVVEAKTQHFAAVSAETLRDGGSIKSRKEFARFSAGTPEHFDSQWIWPAKGNIVHAFSKGNKGIDIHGKWGEPIYAAAAGKVVYSGNGIRGYGNLLILKHNSIYLSAYANNRILFVKEGDMVARGQKIAEMGGIGTNQAMLHFEIRRAGMPINPATVLHKSRYNISLSQ